MINVDFFFVEYHGSPGTTILGDIWGITAYYGVEKRGKRDRDISSELEARNGSTIGPLFVRLCTDRPNTSFLSSTEGQIVVPMG